jgi:hypothetical protein
MPKEEFTIRITKKGEIIVETENLPPRRVKDLIKYLEETLGPARLLEADTSGSPGRVELEVEDALGREEEEEQTKERPRLRIRREE